MQAEDGAKEEMHKSVEKEESKTAEDAQQPPLLQSENGSVLQRDRTSKQNDRSNAIGHLAIVPTRKQGACISGRQSPGGHNVIWGLHSALKIHNRKSVLLGLIGNLHD
jgi:hypothetical protein